MAKKACEKILNFISDQRNTNQWDTISYLPNLQKETWKLVSFWYWEETES